MDDIIPKIAHFIWLETDLPSLAERNIELFKIHNPDWTVQVHRSLPDDAVWPVRVVFERTQDPKARAEALRAWVLWRDGGVYLDADIYTLREFDDLIGRIEFIATRDHGNRVTPCVLGVMRESAAMLQVLEEISRLTGLARPGESPALGEELFNRLRGKLQLKALPEHLFCIFRAHGNALSFTEKDCSVQEATLTGMQRRMKDGVQPFAIHMMGFPAEPKVKDASLGTKIKNVTKAVGRLSKAILTGQKVRVAPEEVERRLDICRGCRFFNAVKTGCRKCGCISTFKNRLNTESCPIGKW